MTSTIDTCFLQLWRLGNPRSRCQQIWFLIRAVLLAVLLACQMLPSHCVPRSRERRRQAKRWGRDTQKSAHTLISLNFLRRALPPPWEPPLMGSPKPDYLPIYHPLGSQGGHPHRNLGEDTSIYSRANPFCDIICKSKGSYVVIFNEMTLY